MLIGTPSNIVIDWGIAGGNLLIGAGGANATSYRLDVRGTANTGTLTSTSVSSAGVELRANDHATYLVALGGLSGANTAITNLQGARVCTSIRLRSYGSSMAILLMLI